MTTWSRPYLRVAPPGGTAQRWTPPADGLPEGAPDPAALGLPPDGKITVRWRGPGSRNARHRTFAVTDPGWVELVRALHAARASGGVGWRADDRGHPVPDTRRRGFRATQPFTPPAD